MLLLVGAAIFLGCIISPPALMDDVDAVQAQIARNMLQSGDWIIAHLDGVPYIEKSPLVYWLMAASMKLFGPHDWAARIPVALAAIFLGFLTFRFGRWAFSDRAGFYAGLVVLTCIGLFLFTRIQIPDVMLTATICAALWCFALALDADEPQSRRWPVLIGVCFGVGLLLKGLIAVVIPCGAFFFYLLATRQLFSRTVWGRLSVVTILLVSFLIAAPWHIAAMRRMPPLFDFTMHSGSGEYHGFFWFYFINEHVLRFLNLRYPRDYNTVPRFAFWLLHLLWLFPWSVYFPAAFRAGFGLKDRAGRARLLALCWASFVLLFFTFSTTQEYYSMPLYPAFALLLGSAMELENIWARTGTKVLGFISALCATATLTLFVLVWHKDAPGDISRALEQHPEAYTLSLGHMGDLTLQSFAYLKSPLLLASFAFLVGGVAAFTLGSRKVFLAIACMMVLFFHAARNALVVFDPYLSSRPLAESLLRSPEGQLIINGQYYAFSSVFFYTNRNALLWNGRVNNLEYGSYAPGSPDVFINDEQFLVKWSGGLRCYILSDGEGIKHLRALVGPPHLHLVAESGGKTLYSNLP